MRHLTLILFAIITTLAIHNTHAQETTPEPYPIVERCLTDLREPPDGWAFEGTIVTFRARDGVHGFRSDFPTRYYIAFDSASEFIGSGSFSPDGQWFATYVGKIEPSGMINDFLSTDYIRVVSTRPSGESYLFSFMIFGFGHVGETSRLRPPRWLDSEQFAVEDQGWQIYSPFTTEITLADESLANQLNDGYAYHYDISIQIRDQFLTPSNSHFRQPIFLMQDATSTRLYTTDEKSEQIYDTCLESRHSFAVSPTGDHAAVSIGDFVYILDLDKWVGYRLNLAANDVVGWFADPVP